MFWGSLFAFAVNRLFGLYMKVIVVRSGHSKSHSIQLTGYRILLIAIMLVLLMGVSVGVSVCLWTDKATDNLLTHEGLQNWQDAIGGQRQDLESVKRNTEMQLDALTLRLAELQGRITRLDALGERLMVRTRLDDGEFDFSQSPPLGGPEESSIEGGLSSVRPALMDAIDQLAVQIDNREQQLELLESLLSSRTLYNEAFVAGLPVRKGWLSSRFGRRTDPFTGRAAWHSGVDFAGKRGSEILAMAAGVVTWAGDRSGYGLLVEVNHGNGYITRYAHNEALDVKAGDIVKRGQSIARMGSSGRSTGDHVHVEVLEKGKKVDPARYIYRDMETH
ncbi:M23 family metallopeptidase [Endozoicomonas sp. Mp262]|uniref:M23 family metallopeptidase n=1 Tax=Endozoicomonas sp. Mp262 TaxID=2919499 RepID=UPI0021D7D75B